MRVRNEPTCSVFIPKEVSARTVRLLSTTLTWDTKGETDCFPGGFGPARARLSVDVADHEEDRHEDRDQIRDQRPREHRGDHADVGERGRPHLQAVRLLLAVADDVIAHQAERILGPAVDLTLPLQGLRELRGPELARREAVHALLDDVAGLLHPLDQDA